MDGMLSQEEINALKNRRVQMHGRLRVPLLPRR